MEEPPVPWAGLCGTWEVAPQRQHEFWDSWCSMQGASAVFKNMICSVNTQIHIGKRELRVIGLIFGGGPLLSAGFSLGDEERHSYMALPSIRHRGVAHYRWEERSAERLVIVTEMPGAEHPVVRYTMEPLPGCDAIRVGILKGDLHMEIELVRAEPNRVAVLRPGKGEDAAKSVLRRCADHCGLPSRAAHSGAGGQAPLPAAGRDKRALSAGQARRHSTGQLPEASRAVLVRAPPAEASGASGEAAGDSARRGRVGLRRRIRDLRGLHKAGTTDSLSSGSSSSSGSSRPGSSDRHGSTRRSASGGLDGGRQRDGGREGAAHAGLLGRLRKKLMDM